VIRPQTELEDHDPVVLQLLQLAVEAIIAHPRVLPPALYEQCSAFADDLAAALTPPAAVALLAAGAER